MDYVWMLNEIFVTVIIPLLGILTIFIIKCVNTYCEKLKTQTNNELVQKYIGMLNDIIITCVNATNQTYVDTLKRQGQFNLAAQEIAFNKTKEAVLNILSEEMENVLTNILGDLDVYIDEQIEYFVRYNH